MIKVITPPTEEPITLAEAKANLRQVFDDEDDDIERMIRAARQMAEERLNRALMPQVLAFAADAFCGPLRVPRPPLRQLDSIKYIDTDGVEQTLTGTVYLVDSFRDPPIITAAYGTPWPTTRAQAGAVKVQYQAGYADAASVPEPIRQWMLLAINAFYEHRSAVATEQTYALPEEFACWLLQPYKVYQ